MSEHRTRRRKKGGYKTRGQKRSNKSTKFCKLIISFYCTFILILHYIFLRVYDYLTEIIHYSWLSIQLQVREICETRRSFFKIPNSRNLKTKSSEGFVCYNICAEALKVQGKYFLILALIKTPFIRKYIGT